VPNGVGVSLARNRRSPKRPCEPRPSGVHPEEDAVEKRQRSFPLENDGCLLGMGVQDTAGTYENLQRKRRWQSIDGKTVVAKSMISRVEEMAERVGF
jgi:hypothetical protein